MEIWGSNSTLSNEAAFDLNSNWTEKCQWEIEIILAFNSSTKLYKGKLPGQPERTKKSGVPKTITARLLDKNKTVLWRYSNGYADRVWFRNPSFDRPEPCKFIVFHPPEDLGLQAEIDKDGESVTLDYLDAEGDYYYVQWSGQIIDLISGGPKTIWGIGLEGKQVKACFGVGESTGIASTVWYIPPWVSHVMVEVGFWNFWFLQLLHHQFETMSTHTNSPDHMPIQPLHNPSLAAQVIVSQALIDNGSIAPLAKKGWVLRGYACRNDADGRTSNRIDAGGRTSNPTFCSPTDNLLTPCTRKLSAARKKHFNKYAISTTWTRVFWLIFLFRPKTVQLLVFPQEENNESNEEEHVSEQVAVPTEKMMEDDDENPF